MKKRERNSGLDYYKDITKDKGGVEGKIALAGGGRSTSRQKGLTIQAV